MSTYKVVVEGTMMEKMPPALQCRIGLENGKGRMAGDFHTNVKQRSRK